MKSYTPSIQPSAQEWLATEEIDRIRLVREYHESSDDEVDDLDESGLEIHSAIHVLVENQIALGVEFLPETMAKLIRQGLDRHDALHAIGAIISQDIFEILKGNGKEFSPKRYRAKLEKITAKRWREGQY
jgi:hypothetical protein